LNTPSDVDSHKGEGKMNDDKRQTILKKTFDDIGENYDTPALSFFVEGAKDIATFVNYRGVEKVIDIATGTGHVAFALAPNVTQGEIIGIDLSSKMLVQAKAKKEKLNISNVRFLEMDMQALEFPPNHFDIAICAFSIFFVEDMEGLICHISDKVKPRGKIIVSTFYENIFMPLIEVFWHRLKQYGITRPRAQSKRVGTKEKCRSLFKSAGLADILVEQRNLGRYLKDTNEWWDVLWNSALRRRLSELSPQVLEKFKTEHLREVREHATDDGIWLEVQALYTMGTKT
jgi:ubiquinone/menaquinone biosynthesis C-methylase UbiE